MLSLIQQSKLFRSLLSAFAGLLGYGAWAFYVNYAHGFDPALKAAFTQGTYSFIITLTLTLAIDFLYQHLPLNDKPRFLLVWLLASLAVGATSWSVNFLAGTPEILMTILPGVIISSCYNFFYLTTLQLLLTRRP